MRLRNVKNKEELLNKSKVIVNDPEQYRGKWKDVFDNDNPIHIEIGMGKGKFIVDNAKNFPNINFIGIEKYDSVIARATQKADELELPNLKMIRYNALEIEKIFNKEIDTIYLNFSDPWPKKRHHNRRLTSTIFLEKYDDLFKNQKKIVQKTDNLDLFEYSLVSISQYGYKLENVFLDLSKTEEFNITTEYEEKFIKENKPIYKLVAIKK